MYMHIHVRTYTCTYIHTQAVLVENANLKAEIRKLRIENTDLLRRVRFADSNAHYMRVCPFN